MNGGWLTGAGLGLLAAVGVLVAVRAAPPMRPIRLADRIAPYLGDTPPPSRLLDRPTATTAPFVVARRLFGPALADAVRFLDRVVGGAASVRRRLAGLGSHGRRSRSSASSRCCGASAGGVLLAVAGARRRVRAARAQPVLVVLAALGGLVAGVLARDWWLTPPTAPA